MPTSQTITLTEDGSRLDRALVSALPEHSRARLQGLIEEGAVTLNGQVITKVSHRVSAGDEVTLTIPELRAVGLVAQDLDLDVLYEDEDVVVLYKTAGMVVHPSKGHQDGTLVNALMHAVDDLAGIGGEERPGIVHRLDKGTSGVMIVAKRDDAHNALREQFTVHSVDRVYLAVTLGTPSLDAGRIENRLGRAANDRLRFTAVEHDGRKAVTTWKVMERLGPCGLFECRLETGRTHQVRVHLSEMGYPILGDPLYRGRRTAPPPVVALLEGVNHQLLHAWKLAFDHPRTGERLSFERPPPEDFMRVLRGLRAQYAPA